MERPLLPEISIGIGLVKNTALNQILAESSSLCVRNIYLLLTQHSVKQQVNMNRIRKIVLNSIKQCGSAYLPVVHDLMDLRKWLTVLDDHCIKLLATELAATVMISNIYMCYSKKEI